MTAGSGRAAAAAAALATALVVSECGGGHGSRTGGAAGDGRTGGAGGPPSAIGTPEPDGTNGTLEGNAREIQVLFPSEGDEQLHAEARRILWTASVEDRARQALAELVAGPRGGLLRALPAGARLREFFLLFDGTGFADFSAEIRGGAGGTTGERITLQAIAHTLSDNFPEIRRVVILVDGEEAETLAGHLDLRYPVVPDPTILASNSAQPPGAPAGAPDGDGSAHPDAPAPGRPGGPTAPTPTPPDGAVP